MARRPPPHTNRDPRRAVHWRATWWTGPDAGASAVLGPGAHVVGRAGGTAADTRAAGIEPHHLRVAVDPEGSIELVQLTGRTPVRIDGRVPDGPTRATTFTWVECGGSLLALHPEPIVTPRRPAVVRQDTLIRSTRAPARRPVVAVPEPPPAPPLDTTATLGGLAAALMLAVVTGNPLMLAMGATGVVAPRLVSTWRRRRIRRRRRWALRELVAAERTWHHAHLPTVVACLETLRCFDDRLWARRRTDGDAHVATLGLGSIALDDGTVLDGVPVPIDLGPGARLAVGGPHDLAVAHGLVMQVTTWTGPADVRVLLSTDHPERWRSLHALPHVTVVDEHLDDVDIDTGTGPHTIVVTDRIAALTERSTPLRAALTDPTRAALLAVVGDTRPPHLCTRALHTRDDGTADLTDPDGTTRRLRFAGVHPERSDRALAALRHLRDPEATTTTGERLPEAVELTTLIDTDREAIERRWSTATSPTAVIGCRATTAGGGEPMTIDLVRDGPHALVAGTTGAGKSELLRTLVVGLALTVPPHRLAFVLLDYKGGAAFDVVRDLPHVTGVVTDLDDDLADRTLRSLHAELRRRERVLREHGTTDVGDLHEHHPDVQLPRLVVVIDEFAALVAERPTFLHALVGIAQRGRSLGVHLVLATQRPQGVVSDDIRANTDMRIALRLQHPDESRDLVGTAAACALSRRAPGRALLRTGAEEPVRFQTAWCADPGAVVREIAAAAATVCSTPPRPPWCPPLPRDLRCSDLPGGAIGLIDLPDEQLVRPLQWSTADGGVLVGAGARTGGTTSLQLLTARALADDRPVYVLDGGGDPSWAGWNTRPGCGGIVSVHDQERLWRLLHHCSTSPCVLVVDRLDTVRMVLDEPSTLTAASTLDRLLTEHWVTLLATVTDLHTVPSRLGSRLPHRWQLTGGGRVVLTDGSVGRLAADPVPPTTATPGRRPTPTVEPVASTVARRCLGPIVDGHLPIGLGVPSGAPVLLDLRPGDHLLVIGGRRTGRTTTLATLAAVWRDAHPDEPLVVVDDADDVNDADGELAELARDGRTTIVAAVRPDALRAQYGHWTGLLRRSRRGLVATGGSDLDGDLLGQVLPRTLPAAARPGLMWLVSGGAASLVQVAQG